MPKIKILLPDVLFNDCRLEQEILSELNPEMEYYTLLNQDDLKKAVKGKDALIVNTLPLGEDIIREMDKCRVISRYGTGYDNVDIAAAKARGIEVGYAPEYCNDEVAEHAAALLLSAVREIPRRKATVTEGPWKDAEAPDIIRIKGKVLGVLGYGKIAKAFITKMAGFGFSAIKAASRSLIPGTPLPHGALACSPEEILTTSDFLCLHLPLTDESSRIINRESLTRMKKGAFIINTSRGGLIDTDALYEALLSGQIRGVGLDVHDPEPPLKDHPIYSLPQTLATNHIAYYSRESINTLRTIAARNVLETFRTGRPLYPVEG